MLNIFIENNHDLAEKKNIINNGLTLNNKIKITKNIDTCDFIFMDYRDYDKAKHYNKEYLKKLVIIDYRDDTNKVFDIPCLKYFKRSVVSKDKFEFTKYNKEIIPISYCLKNEMLEFKGVNEYNRNIDISIFFELNKNSYRSKVANFIKDNFTNYNIHVGLIGKNGKIGRNSIQKEYFDKMFHSKIVVSCNPCHWEGDWRTWETLSSGALLIVDKMLTPIKNPLLHQKHLVYYDRNNLEELKNILLYYLQNDNLRKKISNEGRLHAIKYHKTSDRMDEIINEINK